jgi:hypothetical protein
MKRNNKLLNEELKKFNLLAEYAFYEDRDNETDDENLLLGNIEEAEGDEEEEDVSMDDVLDDEAAGDEDLGPDDEDLGGDEDLGPDDEDMGLDDEGFGDEDDFGGDDETIELDVTELVKGSEETKASVDNANEKITQLMDMVGKLETQLHSMEEISKKIDFLELELEKRAPTPEEKIEMRSLDSYPYNLKLTDFWATQKGQYDILGSEDKEEEKEYVLTQDDIESDYSDSDIKSSFDVEDEEDEENMF